MDPVFSNSAYGRSTSISDFSGHLFWDVKKETIDLERNKKWLIGRVLEYGLLEDWHLLYNLYGIEEIGRISSTIRSLDARAASFVSLLAHIPIENFSCYTFKQSNPGHWSS